MYTVHNIGRSRADRTVAHIGPAFRGMFVGSILGLMAGMPGPTLAGPSADELKQGALVGYARVGAGSSARGGAQECYYLANGNGHGYRLGNECDSYAELGYARSFAESEDGVTFNGYGMLNHYSPDSSYTNSPNVAQIFAEVTGLEFLNGGSLWVGKRFYQRPDIYIVDFQYINLNGTGAGIENIQSPWGGTISYAIFKDNDTNNEDGNGNVTSSNSAVRHNLLYRGLPVNEGGTLDLIAGYIVPGSRGSDRHSGYNLHVFHHQKVLGGVNTFGVQYGVGPGTSRPDPVAYDPATPWVQSTSNGPCCNRIGPSGSTLLDSGDTRFRVLDTLVIQPNARFSAAFDVVYEANQGKAYGGKKSEWISIGLRPVYALTNHFKLQAEFSHDRMSYPDADDEHLTKITFAPTIAIGSGFYARPELRAFVTHAFWNRAATGAIAANTNAGDNIGTHGTTVGVQVEAWWGKNWF